jgi:hypothetical protein
VGHFSGLEPGNLLRGWRLYSCKGSNPGAIVRVQ